MRTSVTSIGCWSSTRIIWSSTIRNAGCSRIPDARPEWISGAKQAMLLVDEGRGGDAVVFLNGRIGQAGTSQRCVERMDLYNERAATGAGKGIHHRCRAFSAQFADRRRPRAP